MTIKEINQAIDVGQSLRQIAQAYGEIAIIKIKKIRAAVERNRLFLNEIEGVYRTVKQQASLRKIFSKKPKKTISILLTSNFRFSGNIDINVIKFFIESTPKLATDRIVIGKTGLNYLKAMNYFHTYQAVELKEDLPKPLELHQLSQFIKNYTQVLVFYPQLSTLLVQKEVVSDITQSYVLTQNPQLVSKTVSQPGIIPLVIFEPELAKMLDFFENQIITLLLEQTFFEAELSRTGSRIMSMDQAQIGANDFIQDQERLKAHIQRVEENAHLLDRLTSQTAIRRRKLILNE
ncbi:F0F1 ATP synthase subunit gamma [Candidatus Microgenomates bacterium]|nr:F0F1 ATP synthase subunit gamma [Candidatus Microgenomates bacterium]